MANNYRKLYIHLVFAFKNKNALLKKSWRQHLFRYIAGIVDNRGHFSLAVNGSYDHIHVFFGYIGKELIEDVAREIKKASSKYTRLL